MERIRVNKESNYTVVNNCFIKSNLSLRAKGFFLIVMSLPEDWDFTVTGIAKYCNESKEVVYSILKELEEQKFLKKRKLREQGRFSGVEYVFLEKPENERAEDNSPHTDLPHTDLPHTDLPHTDSPYTDLPPQLSTISKLSTIHEKSTYTTKYSTTKLKEKNSEYTPPLVAPPPPSLEQVKEYFKGKVPPHSYTPVKFFNVMDSNNWCYKGRAINDWQVVADKWIKLEAYQPNNQSYNPYKSMNHINQYDDYGI